MNVTPPRKAALRAAVFDFDGTLADTFPLIVRAWNESVGRAMSRTFSDAQVVGLFGVPEAAMIRRAVPADISDRTNEAFHACYERCHGMVKPFPGVPEMLSELRRRRVPMGVMSGKGRRSLDITLRKLGWQPFFAVTLSGDEVAQQKPSPEGPLAVAHSLHVDPDRCAFIGDSPVDVGAGRAAGMTTVVAGWHPVYLEQVAALDPDCIAQSPGDVTALFRGSPPRDP